jgi:GTP-binding protein
VKPTIVLVGRPNVGKSTLFNRLTRTRDALVADQPGLTRDRHYGIGRLGDRDYLVVDTAGFDPVAKDGIMHEMARQAEQAIAEADVLLFLVDGRAGRTPHDENIAARLRRAGRPVHLVVNKAEGMDRRWSRPTSTRSAWAIRCRSRRRMATACKQLIDISCSPLSRRRGEGASRGRRPPRRDRRPPERRQVHAGQYPARRRARDRLRHAGHHARRDLDPLRARGRRYTLIDTAGLRRRGKVFEAVEKFSVIKTLQAIQECNVVVLVLDAAQDISDQDAHIAGFALEAGRALVVAVNKWDAVDDYRRERLKGHRAQAGLPVSRASTRSRR